jgi:tyrosyl-tRNA synthetase
MSASIPESRILVHDSEDIIKRNIKNAYCQMGMIKDNPILQLTKFIIFGVKDKFKIERDKKFGGDIIFDNYDNLEKSFIRNEVHPFDLKNALSKELITIFKKVRIYFEKNKDLIPKG